MLLSARHSLQEPIHLILIENSTYVFLQVKLCPSKIHVEDLTPVPQNGTSLEDRVFTEVIKSERSQQADPNATGLVSLLKGKFGHIYVQGEGHMKMKGGIG